MMPASASEIQSLLAAAFERRGWTYDLGTGRAIAQRALDLGGTDASVLVEAVPAEFLARNGVDRADVAATIGVALAGVVPREAVAPSSITINDNRYSISVGGSATLSGSNLNAGGVQLVVSDDAPSEAILEAVSALVRSALVGSVDPGALAALGAVVEGRDDVDHDDVRRAAAAAFEAEQPDISRVKALLAVIATNAIGGALGTGLSAALGAVL
jgi:hypothetical protein